MKLVLQCSMCGTHHPVGTVVCSTCHAEGVNQLRLMFECQQCGRLGLAPQCVSCPPAVPPTRAFEVIPTPLPGGDEQLESLDLDDDLIIAEEVEPSYDLDGSDVEDKEEDVKFEVVDDKDEIDLDEGNFDSDLDDISLNLDELDELDLNDDLDDEDDLNLDPDQDS